MHGLKDSNWNINDDNIEIKNNSGNILISFEKKQLDDISLTNMGEIYLIVKELLKIIMQNIEKV